MIWESLSASETRKLEYLVNVNTALSSYRAANEFVIDKQIAVFDWRPVVNFCTPEVVPVMIKKETDREFRFSGLALIPRLTRFLDVNDLMTPESDSGRANHDTLDESVSRLEHAVSRLQEGKGKENVLNILRTLKRSLRNMS